MWIYFSKFNQNAFLANLTQLRGKIMNFIHKCRKTVQAEHFRDADEAECAEQAGT